MGVRLIFHWDDSDEMKQRSFYMAVLPPCYLELAAGGRYLLWGGGTKGVPERQTYSHLPGTPFCSWARPGLFLELSSTKRAPAGGIALLLSLKSPDTLSFHLRQKKETSNHKKSEGRGTRAFPTMSIWDRRLQAHHAASVHIAAPEKGELF